MIIPLGARVGGVAALAAAAFGGGWKVHDWKTEATLVDQQTKFIAALQKKQEEFNEKASELEGIRAENQKLRDNAATEVEKIVDRPVYVRECFDDDGLRALNSAIKRRPINSAKPASAVP